MACGCVVVSNEGPNVEWLLNSENSELSSCDPVELAKAINGLLADDSKIVSLREKGILYAESTDWSKEGDKLVNVLKGLTE
jgi:glycosyltransferase involved in cell wall biosynthesis